MFALVAAPRQNVLRGLIPRLFRFRGVDRFHALERARRGAKMLDDHFGTPDWDIDINTDTLNIGNPCNCVLGQLYDGSYNEGCRDIRIDPTGKLSSCFGFNADGYGRGKEGEFRALNHAWLVVIGERRRARGVTAWAS